MRTGSRLLLWRRRTEQLLNLPMMSGGFVTNLKTRDLLALGERAGMILSYYHTDTMKTD